ncbi:PaREP1 family protein [Vulcanisaeta distributa]|uniref:PaREP1 family protein n=1 Tax=Vulcanisaeta distributa TaxID=164451 RepID=UPI001FB326C9|nr:PaREP1 family protein [Vulcanisaeta distributa]
MLDALMKVINLDPSAMIEARIELANKYLKEGKELIDKDPPVQASEKLYKAAEECVKALAQYYDLKNILGRVNERGGRWTVTELEKAVEAISERLGDWFGGEAWDRAWALHVWGDFTRQS